METEKKEAVSVEFTMTVTTVVHPDWIEFVTGGPEGMCDIFFQNGHCGYWMMGVVHGQDVGRPELGWLAFEFAAQDRRPGGVEKAMALQAWKEGTELPPHWLRLDLDLAKRSWEEGFKKDGAEWFENGDGCTYDCAVQRALFKGEVVYG